MTTLRWLQRMHQHRAWVNAQLLDTASTLPEVALHRQYAIGQGCIWASFLHMFAAEFHWLQALQGNETPNFPGDAAGFLPGNQQAYAAFSDFPTLRQAWLDHEQLWQTHVHQASEQDLEQSIAKVSSSVQAGRRLYTRAGDIWLHVCLHAHYTSAQVVNMFRSEGVQQLPSTMLIALVRQEMAAISDPPQG